MDLSAQTDTHQQQEQQQQQQQQHQAYDPSQVQAYYTYPHQYDQQQQYPYYPPDHTSIYQQHHHHHHHHEPASIHPPGVPIPPETTTHLVAPEYGQTHLLDQQHAYYPQGVVEQQHQQLSNSDSATAAAAAVAFPQWQGNGAGFGAMPVHDGSGSIPQPIGQSPYRGGGRRGGRPFRGGGRSRGGFRSDGSGSPFRGRGRGRGGGRFAPSEGPAAVQAHAAPHWPPPRMAWCELCRVDCNTLEILEQHKNGKRHKKNLQVFEELQNLNKLITGMQNQQMPTSEFKPEGVIQPEKVEGFEEKQPPPENLPSEAATDDRSATELQKDLAEKSEMAELTEEPERKLRTDHFEARGRGLKRTMRGGRGGKRIRTTEGPRRPVEPPRPKQVIPFICELCNVKCDSQVVFDSHLAGKKHLSNFKKYQGYQAILGAVVLQALCQPNPSAPSTSFFPQLHQQGFHDPQGFFSQPAPYMLPQAQVLAPAPVPVMESQDQQDSQIILEASNQNPVAVEAKSQLKSIEEEVKSTSAMNNDTKTENETSRHLDSSVMAPSESIVEGTEWVLSATATDKAVLIPKCEVASSDQGVPAGVDCKLEEPEVKE